MKKSCQGGQDLHDSARETANRLGFLSKESLQLLEEAAALNNTLAQAFLSNVLMEGSTCAKKDVARATMLLDMCMEGLIELAHEGDLNAQVYLGRSLVTHHDVRQRDIKQALMWFEKAASSGFGRAIFNLGSVFEQHFKDTRQAFQYYMQGAKLGHPHCMNIVGMCYETGDLVEERDFAKAFYWYEKASHLGYAPSIYNLGWIYHDGRGIAKDEVKGAELIKRSADLGFGDAIFDHAWCLSEGCGVPLNETKAAELFLQLAESGDCEAQCEYGYCLLEGRGVVQHNEAEAMRWFKRAIDEGNSDRARVELAYCYRNHIRRHEGDEFERGMPLLQEAASNGYKLAYYPLAECYWEKRDSCNALFWALQAQKADDNEAETLLRLPTLSGLWGNVEKFTWDAMVMVVALRRKRKGTTSLDVIPWDVVKIIVQFLRETKYDVESWAFVENY